MSFIEPFPRTKSLQPVVVSTSRNVMPRGPITRPTKLNWKIITLCLFIKKWNIFRVTYFFPLYCNRVTRLQKSCNIPKSRGKYMFLLTFRALKSHFTVSSSIYAYHLYCQQRHAQDAKKGLSIKISQFSNRTGTSDDGSRVHGIVRILI